MAGSNEEPQELTSSLEQESGAFGMEVNSEKSKVMVNSNVDKIASITMNGQQFEEGKDLWKRALKPASPPKIT